MVMTLARRPHVLQLANMHGRCRIAKIMAVRREGSGWRIGAMTGEFVFQIWKYSANLQASYQNCGSVYRLCG